MIDLPRSAVDGVSKKKALRLVGAGLCDAAWRLVEDLQAELEDARLEGAGDLATGGGAVE
jgi:hypothetical protein